MEDKTKLRGREMKSNRRGIALSVSLLIVFLNILSAPSGFAGNPQPVQNNQNQVRQFIPVHPVNSGVTVHRLPEVRGQILPPLSPIAIRFHALANAARLQLRSFVNLARLQLARSASPVVTQLTARANAARNQLTARSAQAQVLRLAALRRGRS